MGEKPDPRIDYLYRTKISFNACRSIPTPALEAGVVEKMISYFRLDCDAKKVLDSIGTNEFSTKKLLELLDKKSTLLTEIIKLLEEKK